ncbi:MAG: ATP synthase F1 subunit gamma [Lachnospiraceae bacterium]|nr:ATP synthase F1 subunit gamma [Lachnospiraceae bacterium]
MPNTREIQERRKSIGDTMKITNAMYMISSTKLRKARRELDVTERYFYTLQSVIARMLRHMPAEVGAHRYIENEKHSAGDPKSLTAGFLVITADKGMAGAYNHNVLKAVEEEMKNFADSKLLVVGEVGRQYFHTKGIPVEEHFLYTAQNPTQHRARLISAKILDMYDEGLVDEVYVVYTSMLNAAATETRFEQLLPLFRPDFSGEAIPMEVYHEEFRFEPSLDAVMDNVIPEYVLGYVYGALMESYCSEHSARMTAMQSANDSAKQMLAELSVEYNRVRQGAITQQITEVAGGARAQKKHK